MIRRIFPFVIFAILLTSTAFAQTDHKADLARLRAILLENHVSPPTIDNHFSEHVFDRLMDDLDPERVIFLKGEVEALSEFRHELDEEFNGKRWLFLPSLASIYRQALERCLVTLESIPDDRVADITGYATPDSLWASTLEQLRHRMIVLLKREMVERFAAMRRGEPSLSDAEFIAKASSDALALSRTFVRRGIDRMLNHASGFEAQLGDLYLGTMAQAFDPHSSYMSASAVENFMASLSSEGYYFGFSLDENDRGEITIVQLSPGGPAWRSGLINVGDVITRLKWEGKAEIDLLGASLEEVEEILMEDNHTELEIELARPGGTRRRVTLRKEKMKNDANVVKSFLLNAERKIGYIALPGFYTDWGETDGARCAEDVAREIIKLKKEDIDGLIFDLRWNGGGSLEEALSMVGIFIDAGPVSVVRENGEFHVLKDVNRGMVYSGPLVIMVNRLSASASEFVAAALQDHNRAIIVGSETFGKATGQALFPLGANLPAFGRQQTGQSFASVTVQKIYRVTGATVQRTGLVPHIRVPDLYDSIDYCEASLPGAILPDSAEKETWLRPMAPLPVDTLRELSARRVAAEPSFDAILRFSSALAEIRDRRPVLLDIEDNLAYYAPLYAMLEETENIQTPAPYSVVHHTFDAMHMELDEHVRSVNEVWREKLESDVQLREGFHIINDYISILEKVSKK